MYKRQVIDESKKASLVAKIKDNINNSLKDLTEEEKLAYLEENDILTSKEENGTAMTNKILAEPKKNRKLPPPSSDQQKWWVGNGKQAKVSLHVDANVSMLNPNNDVNPFLHTDEPILIKRNP